MKNNKFYYGFLVGIAISYAINELLDFILKVVMIFNK